MSQLTPDAKRAILRALDEGTLDPDDTLSSTEVEALREVCAPTRHTYRLVVDVEVVGHRDPGLDHMSDCVRQIAEGLVESDAFPDLTAGWPDTEPDIIGTAVFPGLPNEDPLP